MKHIRISVLTLCLSAFGMMAKAQNVTLHKQGGVGQAYEVEKVDSVVYFPIGDTEQFPAPEVEITTTLWDVIKTQPQLKKFTSILEAASYYTGKGKPSTSLHFSQLLDGNVPLSVYAPADAAISEAQYTELLNLAKSDGWKLQQEFILNHISPQEGTASSNGKVMMLNGKAVMLNAYTVVNEACNNGQLYTVASCIPYQPNMAEYLMDLAPDCSLAREFMTSIDGAEKTFDAANSVSLPSKDGNMQVLDSVFSSHSRMMDQYIVNDNLMQVKGFGADLANENASYSMVMPTDQIWNEAQDKLALLYKYAVRYEDKVKGDQGATSYIDVPNMDSMSALYIGANALVPLFGRTTSGQETRLSNGIAYTATEWPVPASEYKPNVEVDLTGLNKFYFIQNTSTYFKVGEARLYDMIPLKNITQQYGNVSNDNFINLIPVGPTTNPRVEIKLVGENGEQVMSGKYDICVVMVPYWYVMLSENPDYYAEFLQNEQHFVDSISATSKQSFTIQMRYNNNSTNGKDVTSRKSSVIAYEESTVDTLTILEDFDFPYSYKNIPNSYPTLILEGATKSSTAKQGFMYGLCIDKIILKSKEDGSEIEVTP